MCDLTPVEYEHYKLKQAWKIEYKDAQDVIISLSANFGSILEWISSGLRSVNDNSRLPSMCILNVVDLNKYSTIWKRHVNEERQVLDNLKRDVLSLQSDAKKKLKLFYEEESDEYSSYSDYSEETSSSDEEDDDDDDDDDRERHRDKKKEKSRSREKNSRERQRYAKNYSQSENACRQSDEEEEEDDEQELDQKTKKYDKKKRYR
jgi:hypothetical protein